MRSRILLVVFGLLAMFGVAAPAWAGSPHFVDGTVVATADGATLTVSGKEAGLGDETQVFIRVTATAGCLNPGENFPQAGNKQSFTTGAYFPVQNGKANFTLTVIAEFSPSCSPPMSVVWLSGTVTDETNGISQPLTLATTLAAAAVSPLTTQATLTVTPDTVVTSPSSVVFDFAGCGYDVGVGVQVDVLYPNGLISFFGLGDPDAGGCVTGSHDLPVDQVGVLDVQALQQHGSAGPQPPHLRLMAEDTITVLAA